MWPVTPSLLLLTYMPIFGCLVIRFSKHAPVYRAIVGSPKTHKSICSYWGPKDNPPFAPMMISKCTPPSMPIIGPLKSPPMPVLVSVHAPFYVHIIRYRKTPPPPHFGLQRCPSLCAGTMFHTRTLTLSLSLPPSLPPSLPLHMPIFGSPKATLSICSEVVPLYVPILASPNTQLSVPTLRFPVMPPLSACISSSKHIRLTFTHF